MAAVQVAQSTNTAVAHLIRFGTIYKTLHALLQCLKSAETFKFELDA
jgi:hypothetical protein